MQPRQVAATAAHIQSVIEKIYESQETGKFFEIA